MWRASQAKFNGIIIGNSGNFFVLWWLNEASIHVQIVWYISPQSRVHEQFCCYRHEGQLRTQLCWYEPIEAEFMHISFVSDTFGWHLCSVLLFQQICWSWNFFLDTTMKVTYFWRFNHLWLSSSGIELCDLVLHILKNTTEGCWNVESKLTP